MNNIIIFGPPGSGKGTQAARIKDKYQLTHLSTGDLLREEIAENTELGKMAKNYMEKGELVPDEVIIKMVRNKITNAGDNVKGVIFDGFPRTVAQAEALDAMLAEGKEMSIKQVLLLDVSEEEITQRILERGKTSGRADDQDEATIRRRVQEYEKKTAPVAAYYEKQNIVHHVNGLGSVNDVTKLLTEKLDLL